MDNSFKRIMLQKDSHGFSLVELLVVMTIVGILSSVVLSSLNTSRNKGADTAVKANLSTVTVQAEIVYDRTSSYSGVCADSTVTRAGAAASSAGGGPFACNNGASSWAASTQLKTQNLVNEASGVDYWCVDNTGNSKLENDPLVGSLCAL